MSTVGMKFLSSLISSDETKYLISFREDYLRKSELLVYKFMSEHFFKYGVLPALDTIRDKVGVDLPEVKDSPSFYLDEVKNRYYTKIINHSMLEVQSFIHDKNPTAAIKALIDTVGLVVAEKAGGGIYDFRNSARVLGKHYKKKVLTGYHGIKTGWEYLDVRMGGLEPGDLMTILGRPGMGKTMLLLKIAHYNWKKFGTSTLIITPEMSPMQLFERLAALEVSAALTPIQKTEMLLSDFEEKVLSKLEELKNKENPLLVVSGADCQTIEDLFILTRHHKPDVVLYDGAYLMKHKSNLSKWERISESAAGLKDLAMVMSIPVIAAYQFRNPKGKKKLFNAASQDDVYGSDEIAQLSSIMIGLLDHDTVETVNKRKCTLLKGRSGERGEWSIFWDFFKMNFDEVPKEKAGSLVIT